MLTVLLQDMSTGLLKEDARNYPVKGVFDNEHHIEEVTKPMTPKKHNGGILYEASTIEHCLSLRGHWL